MLTCIGPVIGSFITESKLGWRWTAWLVLILAVVVGIPAFIFVPETYGPVLKERALRKQGQAVKNRNPFKGFVRKFLAKPMLMIVYEPMVS